MKKYNKFFENSLNVPQYVKDLRKLGFAKNKNLLVFKRGCRDAKTINVLLDENSKAIFLDKLTTTDSYYQRKIKVKKVKLGNSYKLLPSIDHSHEKAKKIQEIIKNKVVCDFGSGYGSNFNLLNKNSKVIYGVEISDESIEISKKNFPKISIKSNINDFSNKFDVITMFHVLAHLSNPLRILKDINAKLKIGGKLIIETLHAEDWISTVLNDEEYNKFRFSREFLLFHTKETIEKFLKEAGFRVIDVQYYQRYGYTNLLGWLIDGKSGGHKKYIKYYNDKYNKKYRKKLENIGKSDTLFVIATK